MIVIKWSLSHFHFHAFMIKFIIMINLLIIRYIKSLHQYLGFKYVCEFLAYDNLLISCVFQHLATQNARTADNASGPTNVAVCLDSPEPTAASSALMLRTLKQQVSNHVVTTTEKYIREQSPLMDMGFLETTFKT